MKTPCATANPNKHIFLKEKKKNTPSEGGSRDWGDTSTAEEWQGLLAFTRS